MEFCPMQMIEDMPVAKDANGVQYKAALPDPHFGTVNAKCISCRQTTVRKDPLTKQLVCEADACHGLVQPQVYECMSPFCNERISTACLDRSTASINWDTDGLFCSTQCANTAVTLNRVVAYSLDAAKPFVEKKDVEVPICATVEMVLGMIKPHLPCEVQLSASTTLDREPYQIFGGHVDLRTSIARLDSYDGLAFYHVEEVLRHFKGNGPSASLPLPSPQENADASCSSSSWNIFTDADDEFDVLGVEPMKLDNEEEGDEGESWVPSFMYDTPVFTASAPAPAEQEQEQKHDEQEQEPEEQQQEDEPKEKKKRKRISWIAKANKSVMENWGLSQTRADVVREFSKINSRGALRAALREDGDRTLVFVYFTLAERTKHLMQDLEQEDYDSILWSEEVAAKVNRSPQARLTALEFAGSAEASAFLEAINAEGLGIKDIAQLFKEKRQELLTKPSPRKANKEKRINKRRRKEAGRSSPAPAPAEQEEQEQQAPPPLLPRPLFDDMPTPTLSKPVESVMMQMAETAWQNIGSDLELEGSFLPPVTNVLEGMSPIKLLDGEVHSIFMH